MSTIQLDRPSNPACGSNSLRKVVKFGTNAPQKFAYTDPNTSERLNQSIGLLFLYLLDTNDL